MLQKIEEMGAKLGEGMWEMDFQHGHLTNWLLIKEKQYLYYKRVIVQNKSGILLKIIS